MNTATVPSKHHARMRDLPTIISAVAARPAVLFACWAAWLTVECWAFGSHSYLRMYDVGDVTLPTLISAAKHHSLWVEQWAAGTDRASMGITWTSGILPFMILPAWVATALILTAQRFIAGYFTFLLARRRLGIGPAPALFAAVAYSLFYQFNLNGAIEGFALYDLFGLPCIPLILYLLGDEAESRRTTALAVAMGVMLGTSSLLPLSMFIGPLVIVWFLWIEPKRSARFWVKIFVFSVAWVAATLPSAWALRTLWGNSARAFQSVNFADAHSTLVRTRGFITDNKITFLTGMVIAGVLRFKSRLVNRIGASAVLWLVLAAVIPPIAVHVPFFRSFQFERFATIFPFCCAMFAAVALDRVHGLSKIVLQTDSAEWDDGLRVAAAVIFCALIVGDSIDVKMITLERLGKGYNYAAAYSDPVYRTVIAGTRQSGLRVVSVADVYESEVIGADEMWPSGISTADGYVNLASKRYFDFWYAVNEAVLSSNGELRERYVNHTRQQYLFSVPTYPPLQAYKFSSSYHLPLLSLLHVGYVVSPRPLEDQNLLPVSSPSAAQIRWTLDKSRLRKLVLTVAGRFPGKPFYVYANPTCFPSAFLVTKLRVFTDADQLVHALAESTMDELRSTAYVEKDALPSLEIKATSAAQGTLNVTNWRDDHRTLDVTTAANSILVISTNYSPDWKADIDGAPAEVIPVYRTLIGVPVAPGRHTVTLAYRPRYAIWQH